MGKFEIEIINDTSFKGIPRKALYNAITNVLNHFKVTSATINLIMVNNEQILKMNKQYLGHNYITDVISFNLSENQDDVIGEVYICLPQAQRQAIEYKTTFKNELLRLAIHGILHILGFTDSKLEEKNKMTKMENFFLNKIDKYGKTH